MRKGLLRVSTFCLLILAAALGVRWADREGKFDLLSARIDNSGPVDSALVADILEPWFGRSLIGLDTDSITAALESIEGLCSVSVTVSFPHSIIVEMEPMIACAMVATFEDTCPVTSCGEMLPDRWSDPALPFLSVEGIPDDGFLREGLDLVIKRGTPSVTVCEAGIIVVENGLPIILNGRTASSDWRTWESIRGSVRQSAEYIDLRYSGQAVIVTGEGAGV